MERMLREEVREEDKWNLELIYNNLDSYNKDYKKLEKMLTILEKDSKNLLKDSSSFNKYFEDSETFVRTLDKMFTYAHCKKDEDTANSTYQELYDKAVLLYTKYSEINSSVDPRIIKEDESKIKEYIKKEKKVKEYKHSIESVLRQKKHSLSEEEEKVIAAFTPVFSTIDNTYSYLTNADMKFKNIIDEEGTEQEFDENSYSKYIRSKDRRVRTDAFNILYDGYKSLENTITSLYSGVLNLDNINAKLRGYKSSIESYLDTKNIPVKLYENLIKSVRSNLPNLYRYFDLKKKILKLDEYHLYDGYVSIVDEIDKEYSFEEAKEIVLDALKVYGEEYSNKLQEAFDNRWIDKYPNKNKRGGAYSTGSYDTIPYVLLNYTEEYNDVSTIAHELGHSMHTYFACKNEPFATHDYVIFLAEIASTTNELILNDYMFKKAKTKEEKLTILNEKLDLFKGTIYRQTMFAEFEKRAHDYVDNGGVVTSDYLNNMYYELNKDYFGDNIVVDENIKYEWLRIPHFYSPFYVYQYATSLSIACYVAENILNGTPGFKEKYLELLKAGGKDYPLELLKIIDINLDDTKVFDSANNMFNKTLDEFIEIYEK